MIGLTKARKAAGWTRFKLGAEANIHPARVGQIESGKVVPYPVELRRLADALGEGEPERLLEEVEDESAR